MRGDGVRARTREGRRAPGLTLALALTAATGCSLEEVTLVEAEDVVVAEVYVQLSPGDFTASRATAWLHRTLDGGVATSRPVPGAQILITADRGYSVELAETAQGTCAVATPVEGTGTCYATTPAFAHRFLPGDRLTVEIVLPGGGALEGASTVPGNFQMVGPAAAGQCVVVPLRPVTLRWRRSAGTWAYVNETVIGGLRAALTPQGIEVEEDPLYLLGLSVSADDTSIVFPGEFGVFNRFELDRGVAVALQKGMPANTWARVSITAGDRNYVNWVRGGGFNPSGQVRIPSLRGDGTGVFATTVTRTFRVDVLPSEQTGAPLCGDR